MGSVLGVGDPRVTVTSPLWLLLDQTPSTADISTTDTTRDSKDTRLFHPDVNRNAIIFYSYSAPLPISNLQTNDTEITGSFEVREIWKRCDMFEVYN